MVGWIDSNGVWNNVVKGKNSTTNQMVPRVKKFTSQKLSCVTLTLVDPLVQN